MAQPASAWGSDAVADMLRALGVPWVPLNPGASFRGLHDSLVNHLGNRDPQMLLCLHEEHAVSIAHGWAKVTGRPLAVVLHSNVGLMHGSMAIFNAWCDRVPMLVLGATGPVDAAQRRPWIDWIHTAQDQGALVRHFCKWDDQPASVPAAVESLLRANQIATTAPQGPVYINLDVSLQERPEAAPLAVPPVARYRAPPAPVPAPALVAEAAALLRGAQRPVVMMGRLSRDKADWDRRVALVEKLGATVLTDLKAGSAFPTAHPLHGPPPSGFVTPEMIQVLRGADVILALDCVDLAGVLKLVWAGEDPPARIIRASLDQLVHNGWSMDHQGLPPADIYLLCAPDAAVAALLAELADLPARPLPPAVPRAALGPTPDGEIGLPELAAALQGAIGDAPATLVRVTISWSGPLWDFAGPMDFLGGDGGAGLGSGPGLAVGAALALRGSGRIPVAVLGDGDFMMGVTALWTAARYRIPGLIVVANNRSNFNDELHQERVARTRGRPVENRSIGQAIAGPDLDIAGLARAQGAVGLGPVSDPAALPALFAEALRQVAAGHFVVADVRIRPGYEVGSAAGMMQRGAKA
ncbi:thiamine pyrophosphate-binding protein [Roseomonas sp. BU-1]|uniref:Thiamine pyrophosphate-binding protein n=2 Tax=Falsiroseomonas selenitidurans TaxID=2716335 RepID=A0ABX1E3Q5_9PROT|nr:thiamine pyrophosphate-binding protein [Falsiroseomonas selenitidurans]